NDSGAPITMVDGRVVVRGAKVETGTPRLKPEVAIVEFTLCGAIVELMPTVEVVGLVPVVLTVTGLGVKNPGVVSRNPGEVAAPPGPTKGVAPVLKAPVVNVNPGVMVLTGPTLTVLALITAAAACEPDTTAVRIAPLVMMARSSCSTPGSRALNLPN